MSSLLADVALMVEHFQRSDWRDLYVKCDRFTLFLAKSNGAANPLFEAAASVPGDGPATINASATEPTAARSTTVLAPHLATVIALIAVGSTVQSGSVVGQLDVLGVAEDIVSTAAGTVVEVLVPVGALVEYDAPLLRIV